MLCESSAKSRVIRAISSASLPVRYLETKSPQCSGQRYQILIVPTVSEYIYMFLQQGQPTATPDLSFTSSTWTVVGNGTAEGIVLWLDA